MFQIKWISLSALVLFVFEGLAFAQDTPAKQDDQPTRFYRLDFVVKDFQDGKVLEARNYFVSISDRTKGGRPTSIRADSKVPVVVQGGGVNMYDLDVAIDCGFRSEGKDTLGLDVSVDLTALVPSDGKPDSISYPVVRKNRWFSDVLVTLRKPTTIFSSDDLSSKRKMQIELTATPLAQ